MDPRTEALIRELADKLGTTGEHLWGVMVRQALISGLTSIVVCVALVTVLYFAVTYFQRKTTPQGDEEYAAWGGAFDDKRDLFILFLALLGAATAVTVILSAENIATALLNPEYWALKQLLP
jgi:hypothetical protein